MNRNQEYLELTQELEALEAPAGSLDRALARSRKGETVARVVRPFLGLAAAFAIFVLLVNVSPTVAQACSKVPVLRDLAEALRFSPSLTEAVEHDYYQTVGQKQTQNGVTVSVDYLIVDQRTVNVVYHLEGERTEHLNLIPEVALPEGGDRMYTVTWDTRGGAVEFHDGDVPDSLLLRLTVEDYEEKTVAGPFEFRLEYDPAFTEEGRHWETDQVLELDGQRFHITGVDLYPSYLSFRLEGDPANTAWLRHVDYYLLTDDGRRVDPVQNGVTGYYSPDGAELRSIRTESVYFRDAGAVTLCVTGASWQEKNARTRMDLAAGEAEAMPAGCELIRAARTETGWTVTVRTDEAYTQCFDWTCCDPDGGAHTLGAQRWDLSDPEDSEAAPEEGCRYWTFTLEDYPFDEVQLIPDHTSQTAFSTPVTAEFDLTP